jgi:hypothetical protein
MRKLVVEGWDRRENIRVMNPAGSSPSGLRISIKVDRVSWISSSSLLVLLVLGWMLACR